MAMVLQTQAIMNDDVVLDNWSYGLSNSLVLNNLTLEDAGSYTCRVNSDAGAVYSIPAVLDIYDTAHSCNNSLISNYIELPDECIEYGLNGTNRYDVGKCSRSKCPGNVINSDNQCMDNERHCCAESSTEQRMLTCMDFNISVIVVTGCDCGVCVEPTKVITGRAVAADNREPLQFGKIFIGSELIMTTSSNGEFIFDVPIGRQRIPVTFHDTNKNLVDATNVITVSDNTIYHIEVALQRRAPSVSFNASETATIQLGNASQPSVEIEIPPMSIRSRNGSIYVGNVTASVNFIDPRDPQIIDTIQSDLSTRDVEGNVRNLQTFGMVSMNFEDDGGEPLEVNGSIKLYVDAENANLNIKELDEDMLPRLWFLNSESGEWEDIGGLRFESGKRRKRATSDEILVVGDIEVTGRNLNEWYNLDRIQGADEVCFVKVRVYKDEQLTVPMNDVEVTAISKDLDIRTTGRLQGGKFNFFEQILTSSGQTCPRVFCNDDGTKYSLNIRAKYDGRAFIPVNPNNVSSTVHPNSWPNEILESYSPPDKWDDTGFITMSGRKKPNKDGPIYSATLPYWSYVYDAQRRCNAANNKHNHLIFRHPQTENLNDRYEYNTHPYSSESRYEQPRVPCSWYPYEGTRKCVCFIKILVDGPNTNRFRVVSAKGSNVNVNCDEYGFRVASTPEHHVDNNNKSAVCIEFKCSGTVRESKIADPDIQDEGSKGHDMTSVKVIPDENSRNCFLKPNGVNPNLEGLNLVDVTYKGTSVVHFTDYITNFGIWGQIAGVYETCGGGTTGLDDAYSNCNAGGDGSENDSGEPLEVDGSIKIYVDAEKANLNITELDEDMLPRLWFLNPESGEWEDIGELRFESGSRRKRNTGDDILVVGDIEVTGISLNSLWCNIDSVQELDEVCFVKVRVYKDEQLTVPMNDVEVTAITNDLDIRTTGRFRGEKFNFFEKILTNSGQTCPRVFCNDDGSKYSLNIRAKFDSKAFIPVHPNNVSSTVHPNSWPNEILESYLPPDKSDDTGFITMAGRKNPNEDGPIYSATRPNWSDMYDAQRRCNAANNNHNHLIFRQAQTENLNDLYEFNTHPYSSINRNEQPRVPCSWYPFEGLNKRVCFIKILVDGPNVNRFRVVSAKGSNDEINCDEFGFRVASTPEHQLDINNGKSAVCIEFKCSGIVRESVVADPQNIFDGYKGVDETSVKVIPDESSRNCFLKTVNPDLESFVDVTYQGTSVFHFTDKIGDIEKETGVYKAWDWRTTSWEKAYSTCNAGGDESKRGDNPELNWALHYECP
uniref:Cartilage intermediate layer protein 1-like n=1 Tax=Saccoglossus kowalevskii TaxID=10224 RepID=A0ABM0MEF6_SACKO|nr:PREDICTED: cartilage intermediate layer protein 1-like [Saccoglossus kowalevskii]